jgi:hypothetical protein
LEHFGSTKDLCLEILLFLVSKTDYWRIIEENGSRSKEKCAKHTMVVEVLVHGTLWAVDDEGGLHVLTFNDVLGVRA